MPTRAPRSRPESSRTSVPSRTIPHYEVGSKANKRRITAAPCINIFIRPHLTPTDELELADTAGVTRLPSWLVPISLCGLLTLAFHSTAAAQDSRDSRLRIPTAALSMAAAADWATTYHALK